MEKLKYIRKLGESFPYGYEKPPIAKVELWDFSRANENDEARKEAVCLVASISYGNEYCKDPNKLWNLLIERGHESVYEFVRTTETRVQDFDYVDNLRKLELAYDEDDFDIQANIHNIAFKQW